MVRAKFVTAAAACLFILILGGCKRDKIVCPPGAQLMGQPPPQGQEIWCQKTVNGKAVKDGIYILYHESGARMMEGYFKDGKQNGAWTMWYENGHKKSVDHYKSGVQDGEHVGWYPNGQMSAKGKYLDGKRDGVWKRWGPAGIRNWQEVYKNGKKVS